METETGYFDRHVEQAFIAKVLGLVVILILARELVGGLIGFVLLFLPLLFFMYLRYQMRLTGSGPWEILKEHLTFIPVMSTGSERKSERVPTVTYGLIILNVLIFYTVQSSLPDDLISDNLIFLPQHPDFWNLPVSALSSMFLHGSNSHLWGNMAFLWVVGSAVERRIDSGTFLFLYLFTGVMGGLLFVIVEYVFLENAGHCLGASGAIAGIMGIFAVRCYFKSMIFPVPIMGVFSLIFPISFKLRLNSLVVIGLFFYSDLAGGLSQIAGKYSHIGHWVHLGGMITGMVVAGWFLKLGNDAIEERHLEIGIKAAETAQWMEDGERSLNIALERNPGSGEALLAMARLKSRVFNSEEADSLYCRSIESLLKETPQLALEAFYEYSYKYHVQLEARVIDTIGTYALRLKNSEIALRAFSLLADNPKASPPDRERALFQCGRLLEETGEFELAHRRYRQFVEEFPDAPAAARVRLKLDVDEETAEEASPASGREVAAPPPPGKRSSVVPPVPAR
ncbi:rhomboid family intramembrane serine protease [Geomonas sp. Red32]|uniref:rhomboid family intramembrane serine protease n=1 Tax=Geomonas sp. Red32 TaxID=2912856 RepID=UPI00202CD598|nr:rhomboid family intramembrane serine protease [Geomonas sp. Red32]MCM0083446.1 rhomboid family intramembrane serine protease [Geomonas sp. Red32]